jgi:uncharacterized membrane protein YeaQ/YmgE (transglycosylase-associated protein family)
MVGRLDLAGNGGETERALATLAGYGGVTGLNMYSILVAIISAVIVLVVYHAIATRT